VVLCTCTEESFYVFTVLFLQSSKPDNLSKSLNIFFSVTESTLHLLGTNEIHEVIHRTSNAEKLETDLITALSNIIKQSRHSGKCYNDHGSRLTILTVYVGKIVKNQLLRQCTGSCELSEFKYTHFYFLHDRSPK